MPSLAITTTHAPPRKRPRSPGQSATVKQTSGLSIAYAALPMTVKGGWQHTANILNSRQKRTGRQALSAANAYVLVNSGRRLCGLPDTSTALRDFSLPGELPAVTVAATANGPQFRLCLAAQSYTDAVIIEAAKGVAAGKPSTPGSAYKRLCVLPSGLTDSVDLTDVYTKVWGSPEEGAQIAVRVTAVSAAGMRGPALEVAGVVAEETGEPPGPPEGRVSEGKRGALIVRIAPSAPADPAGRGNPGVRGTRQCVSGEGVPNRGMRGQSSRQAPSVNRYGGHTLPSPPCPGTVGTSRSIGAPMIDPHSVHEPS